MLVAYFMLLLKGITLLASDGSDSSLQTVFKSHIPALSKLILSLKSPGILKVWHNGKTICSVAASEKTIFDCHCFPFVSDDYKLFDNDVFVKNFSVVQPNFRFEVPADHKICKKFILNNFTLPCDKINYSLRLQYRPVKVLPHMEKQFENVFDVSISSAALELPKNAFILPGIYRLLLENSKTLLKESNIVKVKNNDEFSINLNQRSIFPQCKKTFKISWSQANCSTDYLNFRLRVFAVPDRSFVERSYYLEEIHLDLNDKFVQLPCSMFDIIYSHFCFELISVHQKTMFFYNWDRKCIPTENLGHVDGKWSSWSQWSECSTSCGQGIKRRFRYCNQPSPKGSGAFCSQNFVESQQCIVPCLAVTEVKEAEDLVDKRCRCGCLINQPKGTFYAQLCPAISKWILNKRGQKLVIYLHSVKSPDMFRLEIYENMQKLKTFYDSHNTTDINVNLQIPIAKLAVIELIPIHLSKNNGGIQISYEWYNESVDYSNIILPSLIGSDTGFLYNRRNFLLLILLASIIIALFPPVLFAVAIRKRILEKAKQSHISLLNRSQIDSEMIRSGNTESTVLTTDRVVSKRSIGIQLSTTSTPRVPRIRLESSSRETSSVQQTPRLRHSSLSCFADHDLEYDYYEPAIPGSFLTPVQDFQSEIDIDQIIGQSCLLDTDVLKSDAHTQS